MLEFYEFMVSLQKAIGNGCNVFFAPKRGGLLVQVDWISGENYIRWQYLFPVSEMKTVPEEILFEYIVNKAAEEYSKHPRNRIVLD